MRRWIKKCSRLLSAEAVGKYLGNYLAKTYSEVSSEKRCRLVRFSSRIGKAISTRFTVHGIGSLIYRTRLKIAAGMLGFTDYGDFADYFGSRWNFMLKGAIGWIPIPFEFERDALKNGSAAKVWAEYADDPHKYLEGFELEKLSHVATELTRRLREEIGKHEALQPRYPVITRGDNYYDASATPDDFQEKLDLNPNEPF
jgi:hypothetical protein